MKTHECPTTQTCRVCGLVKPMEDFSFVTRDSRHATICKPCNTARSRERYTLKRDAIRAQQSEYQKSEKGREYNRRKYERHGHKQREKLRERYATDPEYRAAQKARKLAWHASDAGKAFRQRNYRKHAELFKAHAKRRYRLRRSATPPWFDADKVLEMYERAEALTASTGIPHEVDHIVPLKGENVTGLHWHGNLQVITRTENRRKHNRFTG